MNKDLIIGICGAVSAIITFAIGYKTGKLVAKLDAAAAQLEHQDDDPGSSRKIKVEPAEETASDDGEDA